MEKNYCNSSLLERQEPVDHRKNFFESLKLSKREILFFAIVGCLSAAAGAGHLAEKVQQKFEQHEKFIPPPSPKIEPEKDNKLEVDTGVDAGPQDTSSFEEEGMFDLEKDNFVGKKKE